MTSKTPIIDVPMSVSQLTDAFNQLSPTKVKRLSDKNSATRRVVKLLENQSRRIVPDQKSGFRIVSATEDATSHKARKPRVRSRRSRRRITEDKFVMFLRTFADELDDRARSTSGATSSALAEVASTFRAFDVESLFPNSVVEE